MQALRGDGGGELTALSDCVYATISWQDYAQISGGEIVDLSPILVAGLVLTGVGCERERLSVTVVFRLCALSCWL